MTNEAAKELDKALDIIDDIKQHCEKIKVISQEINEEYFHYFDTDSPDDTRYIIAEFDRYGIFFDILCDYFFKTVYAIKTLEAVISSIEQEGGGNGGE